MFPEIEEYTRGRGYLFIYLCVLLFVMVEMSRCFFFLEMPIKHPNGDVR